MKKQKKKHGFIHIWVEKSETHLKNISSCTYPWAEQFEFKKLMLYFTKSQNVHD